MLEVDERFRNAATEWITTRSVPYTLKLKEVAKEFHRTLEPVHESLKRLLEAAYNEQIMAQSVIAFSEQLHDTTHATASIQTVLVLPARVTEYLDSLAHEQVPLSDRIGNWLIGPQQSLAVIPLFYKVFLLKNAVHSEEQQIRALRKDLLETYDTFKHAQDVALSIKDAEHLQLFVEHYLQRFVTLKNHLYTLIRLEANVYRSRPEVNSRYAPIRALLEQLALTLKSLEKISGSQLELLPLSFAEAEKPISVVLAVFAPPKRAKEPPVPRAVIEQHLKTLRNR